MIIANKMIELIMLKRPNARESKTRNEEQRVDIAYTQATVLFFASKTQK